MPITGFTFTFLQAKVHRHTLKKRNSLSYLHEVAARFKRAATFVFGATRERGNTLQGRPRRRQSRENAGIRAGESQKIKIKERICFELP